MLLPLRKELETEIERRIDGVRVNGKNASRVANTLNLSFEGVEGDGLVMALDLEGIAVSAGSACSSGVIDPSHVLLAMGLSPGLAMASIRISMSVQHTVEDIHILVNILEKVVARVRKAKRPSDKSTVR
jgi:cysteine desulfurase